MRIRVVGIGTGFGDDAAGLLVVQALTAESGLPVGVDAVPCNRPVELIDMLDGVEGVVLVDATCSGRPPGTVHEPAAADLSEVRAVSSHGLGVREALAMARALGRAPKRIAIIGIEAGSANGDCVSDSVRAALVEATIRVRARCAAWGAVEPGAPQGGSDRA